MDNLVAGVAVVAPEPMVQTGLDLPVQSEASAVLVVAATSQAQHSGLLAAAVALVAHKGRED
jgi:hypothetical protein